jgi:hypothetical protein
MAGSAISGKTVSCATQYIQEQVQHVTVSKTSAVIRLLNIVVRQLNVCDQVLTRTTIIITTTTTQVPPINIVHSQKHLSLTSPIHGAFPRNRGDVHKAML